MPDTVEVIRENMPVACMDYFLIKNFNI